jgi:GMP synthase (glutamine-hydrolysing)
MIAVINCGSSKTPNIISMVKTSGHATTEIQLEELEQTDFTLYNGIIISGAPLLLTEISPLPYLKQFSFLKTIEIPVLGICFGHQVLGMLHNATIERCSEDRANQTINILQQNVLFEGLSVTAVFCEDHCECISLPHNFKLIASSTTCKVEAMAHVSKPLFGVQFHPEVSSENGLKLIRNFCGLC